jgi:hypothetical protein
MADPKQPKVLSDHEKLINRYVDFKLKHDKAEEDNRKSKRYPNAERLEIRDKKKEETKTDNQLKSLQSVGQIVGETLKQLTE